MPYEFTTSTFRKGIDIEKSSLYPPLYFPQYDLVFCPIEFSFSDVQANEPMINNRENQVAYLMRYQHELFHRALNIRTMVGLAHFTFIMLKINTLFSKHRSFNKQALIEQLRDWDNKSLLLFNSSLIWDELYTLAGISNYAAGFGLNHFNHWYQQACFSQYPEVEAPYQLIRKIFDTWNEDIQLKVFVLNSIFDTAADIDLLYFFDVENPASHILPAEVNIDKRLMGILSIAWSIIENDREINFQDFLVKLTLGMEEQQISSSSTLFYEKVDNFCTDILETYIDHVVFQAMFAALCKTHKKEMKKYVEMIGTEGKELFSFITVRPASETLYFPVFKESLFMESETIKFGIMGKIEVLKYSCLESFLILGETADLVRKGAADSNPFFLYPNMDKEFIREVFGIIHHDLDFSRLHKLAVSKISGMKHTPSPFFRNRKE